MKNSTCWGERPSTARSPLLSGIPDGCLFFPGDRWRPGRVSLLFLVTLCGSFAQTQYSIGSEHRRVYEKRFLGSNASVQGGREKYKRKVAEYQGEE